MPSLREDITKTFRRFGRRDRTLDASRAETIFPTDPREGKDFGAYRVLRRLGFGGMGQVYLALDTRLGRHAALKFLDSRLTSDPTMLSRLFQEARAASSLNHPNILTIYEIAEAKGEHFIASEYVEGITLRAALDRGLITPKAAIEIAAQVASALVPAHAAGIIHRDLKATNIMIRPDGLVKVIDFGLAKLPEANAAAAGAVGEAPGLISSPGGIAGTVEYMSPEQARGDVVDQRSDLWSLGVVLYEMVAGKFPFDGATESHVIVALLDHPAPPIPNSSALPRGCTAIIDRALTKDRNKRYQSAADMLADLQNLGVTKQRISAIKQFAVLADSRQSSRIALVISGFVALVAAFAIWWFPFHGKERVLGPAWFEPGPPEQVTFDGHVKAAALSPDGKYLAYTTRVGGQETLHIRDIAHKSEWQLPPYSESNRGLTFSPDSQSLYYVLHDQREWGRLFSVDVHGNLPKMLLDDIDGPVAFSPDGKEFAFMRRSEEKRTSVEKIILSEVNDTGSQREIVRQINTHIGRKLAWSDNSDRLAAVIFSPGLHSILRASIFLYSPDGSLLHAPFSEPSLRSMGAPIWLANTNSLALTGVTPWRINAQAGLYEMSATTGEFRALPSPFLAIDSLSADRTGETLAAVQRNRSASFWIAGKTSVEAPEKITPISGTDTSSLDTFTWDEDRLIFPSAQAKSINLVRLSPSGSIEKLTSTAGCIEQSPSYVKSKTAVVYSSNCATFGIDYTLWQLDLRTGKKLQMTNGSSQDVEPSATKGDWIVYTAWATNMPFLWKLPIGGGTPIQISNLQAQSPVVSPDGKSVLCQIRESYDGRWRYAILSLANGKVERELPDLPVTDVRAQWEQNGKTIDYVDNAGTRIWTKSLSGGEAVPLKMTNSNPITDFSWNGDGTKLAFTTSESKEDVILFHKAEKK